MTTTSEAVAYSFDVPLLSGGSLPLCLRGGCSIIFIGANGAGKTRLGVRIEDQLAAHPVHRIAAQKSLSLTDLVNPIPSERANNFLRFGHTDVKNKHGLRWGGRPAIHLLADFDALLQTLFANRTYAAIKHLEDRKLDPNTPVPVTELEKLKAIWDRLLPHRKLRIEEASVKVDLLSSADSPAYPGSEMSDGERAIFYFLGQCIVSQPHTALIVDEPESHIHRAILGTLWDLIEAARPDCGFIYITHDLDFAVSRKNSDKYFINSYEHSGPRWEIEAIPQNTGLPERLVTELVGSRKPILFVEGERGSLDTVIYQTVYSEFAVTPVGSCEAVIHSVASFKKNADLHRLRAVGLIDRDARDANEVSHLEAQDIKILPVAEVENLLLLPSIFAQLARSLLCDVEAVTSKLNNTVMTETTKDLDLISTRHTIARLDRSLKRVELKAKDLASLNSAYQTEIASIDPVAVFNEFKAELRKMIANADLAGVLALHNNKGLLALGAGILGLRNRKELTDKVERLLKDGDSSGILLELVAVLPKL